MSSDRKFSIRHGGPDDAAASRLVHGRDEGWFSNVALVSMSVFIAEATDEPVGLMVLDEGRIEYLYVDEKWRNKGLGSDLLELAKTLDDGATRTTK